LLSCHHPACFRVIIRLDRMIQEFRFPGPPDLVRGQASQGMTSVVLPSPVIASPPKAGVAISGDLLVLI